MMLDFVALAIALIISLAFALLVIYLNYKLTHKPSKSEIKLSTYECGEELLGEAQVRMNVQYYIYGIAYLVADIIAILVLIWAIESIQLSLIGLVGMISLLLVTIFSVVYTSKKQMLKWV